MARCARIDENLIRQVDVGGRKVFAVAPCPEDLIVSKLARLDEKDKAFIEAYNSSRPIDPTLIEERVRLAGFEAMQADLAIRYIRNLTSDGG